MTSKVIQRLKDGFQALNPFQQRLAQMDDFSLLDYVIERHHYYRFLEEKCEVRLAEEAFKEFMEARLELRERLNRYNELAVEDYPS